MNKRDGFTLLETLISISLLAIVLIAVYTALISGSRGYQRVEEGWHIYHTGYSILDMLRKEVLSIDKNIKGIKRNVEGKRMDEIDFIGFCHNHWIGKALEGDASEIGYFVKENEEGGYSLFHRDDFVIDEDLTKGGRIFLLSDKVDEFKISYYYNKNWYETWPPLGKSYLPEAIEVELTLLDSKEKEVKFSTLIPLKR
ncbi:MAG: prepilin-type N-terminal cleavage/methylation domain-containing protein [Deltaproteobacteria bacterium]|nr:prepilin-type N-terminal cleavage/methylation domain-containing protein [Deltaproteobacteria bacterium]